MTNDQLGPLSQEAPPDVVEVLLKRREMVADRRDQFTYCLQLGHSAASCPKLRQRQRAVAGSKE